MTDVSLWRECPLLLCCTAALASCGDYYLLSEDLDSDGIYFSVCIDRQPGGRVDLSGADVRVLDGCESSEQNSQGGTRLSGGDTLVAIEGARRITLNRTERRIVYTGSLDPIGAAETRQLDFLIERGGSRVDVVLARGLPVLAVPTLMLSTDVVVAADDSSIELSWTPLLMDGPLSGQVLARPIACVDAQERMLPLGLAPGFAAPVDPAAGGERFTFGGQLSDLPRDAQHCDYEVQLEWRVREVIVIDDTSVARGLESRVRSLPVTVNVIGPFTDGVGQ